MISGLADRPLSYRELESLNHADAIGFVCPATPNSIQENEENASRVQDLVITTGETVSAVVYEGCEGWTVVGKTGPERPKDPAVSDVIEYRRYDIKDEERVHEFASELFEAIDALREGE